MIDNKSLRALIKLMVDNDLTELDLQDAEGERVTLKRGRPESAGPVFAPPHHPITPPSSPLYPPPTPPQSPTTSPSPDAGLTPITSPMVGTFYAASTAEAKPFVSEGDKVTPETVVCLIEAMKVFNEIRAEATGTIQRVLVNNGKAVEYGQALFMIRPD